MLCKEPGEHSVNFSKYHRVCGYHLNALSNCQRSNIECIYCESFVIVIRHQCNFCLQGLAMTQISQCGHYICQNCDPSSCKLCEMFYKVCKNCQKYSDHCTSLNCPHMLCPRCSIKSNGKCQNCLLPCSKCKSIEEVLIRECGSQECSKCYYKCENCLESRLRASTFKPTNSSIKNEPKEEVKKTAKKLENCIMCGERSELVTRKKCKHLVCTQCINKNCVVCEDFEACCKCNSRGSLESHGCGHKFCQKCFKKNNCWQCNKEISGKAKKCNICGEAAAIIKRECGHECCKKCEKFVCDLCQFREDRCFSCSSTVNVEKSQICNHYLCRKCNLVGCKTCRPEQKCSNCERSANLNINCGCGYLCENCSFLKKDQSCILHEKEFQRHTTHSSCYFTLIDEPLIRRECDQTLFCRYCKNLVKKKSDKKKHKGCKKKHS